MAATPFICKQPIAMLAVSAAGQPGWDSLTYSAQFPAHPLLQALWRSGMMNTAVCMLVDCTHLAAFCSTCGASCALRWGTAPTCEFTALTGPHSAQHAAHHVCWGGVLHPPVSSLHSLGKKGKGKFNWLILCVSSSCAVILRVQQPRP